MMLKKGDLILVQKKKQFLRRVVEGLFLSNAGPKRGCLSYLIAIIRKEMSDVWKMQRPERRMAKHASTHASTHASFESTQRMRRRMRLRRSGL